MMLADAPALPLDSTPVALAAELYVALDLPPIRLYGVNPDGSCQCGKPGCDSQGKHPMGDGWQREATTDLDVVRSRFASHRGNIGIYVGGSRLVLIDADGEEGLATVSDWDMPATLSAQSGSGVGAHYVFALAPHHDKQAITDRRVATGVDVKARGQFVAAPSWHHSGRQYRWTCNAPIATLPDAIYERIRRPVHVVPSRPSSPPTGDLVTRARAYVAKMPPAISGARGHDATFNVARKLVQDFDLDDLDAWSLLLEYNGRCEPPWSERELKHKLDSAIKARVRNPIPDRPLARMQPQRDPEPEPEPEAQVRVSVPDWRGLLLWTNPKTGAPKLVSHCENVVRILSLDPRWHERIRYDSFRGRIVASDPPWDEYSRAAYADAAWTDEDDARLYNWMRRQFHGEAFAPSLADCTKAAQLVAERNGYHPVRDYLDALAWDGTPRLAGWLSSYTGAASDAYTQSVARWWMLSAVARIYEPGCKADHVMILEGEQGIRKSSALKVLGGDWFTDTPIDLNSKDAYGAIRGVWIVELAELDSLMRVEASRAKAFFSSPVDRYRPAYGRREREVARQCVFAGTVNHGEYLRDSSGHRRFWPIACRAVDLDGLREARDQLWAEAVAEYREGAHWWPEASDTALTTEAQDERAEEDVWTESIRVYLLQHPEVTVPDLLGRALGLETRDWTRANEIRIGNVMRALKWVRVRRKATDGTRLRVYIRPEIGPS